MTARSSLLVCVTLLFGRSALADMKTHTRPNGDIWFRFPDGVRGEVCMDNSDCADRARGLHLKQPNKFVCVKQLPGEEDSSEAGTGPWCFQERASRPRLPKGCEAFTMLDMPMQLCRFPKKAGVTIVFAPVDKTLKRNFELPEYVKGRGGFDLPCTGPHQCPAYAKYASRDGLKVEYGSRAACRAPQASDAPEVRGLVEDDGMLCFLPENKQDCGPGMELADIGDDCVPVDPCRPFHRYLIEKCESTTKDRGAVAGARCRGNLKRPADIAQDVWKTCRDHADNNRAFDPAYNCFTACYGNGKTDTERQKTRVTASCHQACDKYGHTP